MDSLNPLALYYLEALRETLSVFLPTRETVFMIKGQERCPSRQLLRFSTVDSCGPVLFAHYLAKQKSEINF